MAVQCLDTFTTENWLVRSWKVTNLSIWAHEDSDQNIQLTAGHQVFPDLEPGEEATRVYKVTCTGPQPGNYSNDLLAMSFASPSPQVGGAATTSNGSLGGVYVNEA